MRILNVKDCDFISTYIDTTWMMENGPGWKWYWDLALLVASWRGASWCCTWDLPPYVTTFDFVSLLSSSVTTSIVVAPPWCSSAHSHQSPHMLGSLPPHLITTQDPVATIANSPATIRWWNEKCWLACEFPKTGIGRTCKELESWGLQCIKEHLILILYEKVISLSQNLNWVYFQILSYGARICQF